MCEFATVEKIDIEQDESGLLLVVETGITKFLFKLDMETSEWLLNAAKREIGPWIWERDAARVTMPKVDEDDVPYEIADPKHPAHHDELAGF